MLAPKIPVSVIVVTKNEEANIARCVRSLKPAGEVIVVDSHSTDQTCAIAKDLGARVVCFDWDGRYPKKRQWCLDNLDTLYPWVFFVDADEVVPDSLWAEIAGLDLSEDLKPMAAGYFVKGRYIMDGVPLKYGLRNNKLCLLHKERMVFPVIDDLGIAAMGEIEGHYQPVLKAGGGEIRSLSCSLEHYAYQSREAWEERHRRYARWEVHMNRQDAWPCDPVPWREALKKFFRSSGILRPLIAFVHCYIWRCGFLDGRAGFVFAWDRARYYMMIYSFSHKA